MLELEDKDRKGIFGDDLTNDGMLVVRDVALRGPAGLSIKLRTLAENTRDWSGLDEQCRDAVGEGKTTW